MRGSSENWVDLADLLETYPYVTFELNVSTPDGLEGGWLYFDGYEIDWKCLEEGEYTKSAGKTYPTNECREKQKSLCGVNYVEELLPGISGCLSNVTSHAYWQQVARPSKMLDALARRNPDAASSLTEFPWVRDGINLDDLNILYELILLPADVDLLGWEFLERVDTWDIHAMEALRRLAEHEGYFQEITSYLEQQGGLSDEEIHMVLALQHVLSREDLALYRSNIIEIMLDPEQTTTIRRVIDLPITGKFTLSVIAPSKSGIPSFPPSLLTHESPLNVMQYLEDSVVIIDEFMGVPFPYDYAFMLVADFIAVTRGGGGYYSGHGLIYSSIEARPHTAHEAAHIYWNSSYTWIIEGAANMFKFISPYSEIPLPNEFVPACAIADNIAEVEKLEHALEWRMVSGCYRGFGTAMFIDLYASLGDAAFRRGFRNLYLALRDETHESICAGEYRSGCYLREAFADGATPEEIAVIDEIVARRYYGRASE